MPKKDRALLKLEKILQIDEPRTKEAMLEVNKAIFYPLLKKYKIDTLEVHYSWSDDESSTDAYAYQGNIQARLPSRKVKYFALEGKHNGKEWVQNVVRRERDLSEAILAFAEELYYAGEQGYGRNVVFRLEELEESEAA